MQTSPLCDILVIKTRDIYSQHYFTYRSSVKINHCTLSLKQIAKHYYLIVANFEQSLQSGGLS